MPRTTDEISYIFREFNTDKPDEAMTEAITHAMRTSVGLVSPRMTHAEYLAWGDDEWYGSDDERPVPCIKVTVVGS